MVLYFRDASPELQPNRKALDFHKTACLIWRLAGGAESDLRDEYFSDDDDEEVEAGQDLRAPSGLTFKDIKQWQDSSATLAAGLDGDAMVTL
jgi:hypothetical protein